MRIIFISLFFITSLFAELKNNSIQVLSVSKKSLITEEFINKLNSLYLEYKIITETNRYKVIIGEYISEINLKSDLKKIKRNITDDAFLRKTDFSKINILNSSTSFFTKEVKNNVLVGTGTDNETKPSILNNKKSLIESEKVKDFAEDLDNIIMSEVNKKNKELKKYLKTF